MSGLLLGCVCLCFFALVTPAYISHLPFADPSSPLYFIPPSRRIELTLIPPILPPRSVPSGRIGPTRDDVFRSNEEFRAAVAERELQDVAEVEAKMGRR